MELPLRDVVVEVGLLVKKIVRKVVYKSIGVDSFAIHVIQELLQLRGSGADESR